MNQRIPTLLALVFSAVAMAAPDEENANALQTIDLSGANASAGIQTVSFAETGLPKQIAIAPDTAELPLEQRMNATEEEPPSTMLQQIGRGPRLVAPIRLQALVEEQWVDAQVVEHTPPAKQENAVTASSTQQIGPYTVKLSSVYRADGELQVDIEAEGGDDESRLRLFIEPLETVDLASLNLPDQPPGAVAREELDPFLPQGEDVVWDSAERMPDQDPRQLYVGNADAGLTWLNINMPELTPDVSRIVLARDDVQRLKWQTTLLAGKGGKASFALRIHPRRHRPADTRRKAWFDWPTEMTALPQPIAGPALFADQENASQPYRRDFPGYLAFAPHARYAELRGNACADMLDAQNDTVTLYPITLFRALAGGPTGLTVRIRPNVRDLLSQYEPALDRQILGRALLHDIGVDTRQIAQPAEFLRVIKALREFGYFQDDGLTEYIPYWRSDGILRYGEHFDPAGSFNLTTDNPSAGTYASAYRRPYEKNGKKGVQVLFVVVNERDNPVRQRLYIQDVERVFGSGNARPTGPNILRKLDYGNVPENSDWGIKRVVNRPAYSGAGLLDLEMRGFVRADSNKGQSAEIYGPLHVPPRNFRLLWAYGLPKK